ncbi:MAG: ATP-dependent helicase HrpB, partial [Hyphomicrobium sp.]
MRRLARGWARSVMNPALSDHVSAEPNSPASILARAYPDRIAKSRGTTGQFLLANGRAGQLDPGHPLARAPYLVIAEMQGRAAATRILLATALDENELIQIAGDRIKTVDEVSYDTAARAVRARRTRRLDAIVLSSEQRALRAGEDVSAVLAAGIATSGVDQLPWSKSQMQLRTRIAFLKSAAGDWPDLSDAALSAQVETWLQPFVPGKTRLAEITPDDLAAALDVML